MKLIFLVFFFFWGCAHKAAVVKPAPVVAPAPAVVATPVEAQPTSAEAESSETEETEFVIHPPDSEGWHIPRPASIPRVIYVETWVDDKTKLHEGYFDLEFKEDLSCLIPYVTEQARLGPPTPPEDDASDLFYYDLTANKDAIMKSCGLDKMQTLKDNVIGKAPEIKSIRFYGKAKYNVCKQRFPYAYFIFASAPKFDFLIPSEATPLPEKQLNIYRPKFETIKNADQFMSSVYFMGSGFKYQGKDYFLTVDGDGFGPTIATYQGTPEGVDSVWSYDPVTCNH